MQALATQQLFEMFERLDRGLGADDPDDYFDQVLEAIRKHPLFTAFEAHMQVDYQDMWVFAEDPQSASEDVDAFRDFLQARAPVAAVPPAGSQAKVATVPPAGSQAKVAAVPPAGSQARVGPTAAICDMDSAGRQASTVSSSEGSDSDGDFETNQALLAVQNAFRRSSSEARTAAKEPLMSDDDDAAALEEDDAKSLLPPEDDVELLPPALFDDTFAWFFLQEAWSKLTVEERRSCRLNVTKSTHAMGEHVSRDAGSRLPIATMCSGSGMAELAHRILTEALGHRELFLHSCEKERFKKKHLLKTVHPLLTRPGPAEEQHGCLFAEFADLAAGQAFCEKHQRVCLVHECPFLIVCGYSCKNLSKLNANNRAGVLRAGLGSSGETCDYLLNYLKNFRPAVALLENVEEMARDCEESDNVAYFLGKLEDLEYAFATKLLDSSNYGLPQRRLRSFQILLNRRVFQTLLILQRTWTESLRR